MNKSDEGISYDEKLIAFSIFLVLKIMSRRKTQHQLLE